MSAAVLSPLGTNNSNNMSMCRTGDETQEEAAHNASGVFTPLFHNDDMDNDSVPSLSEDLFGNDDDDCDMEVVTTPTEESKKEEDEHSTTAMLATTTATGDDAVSSCFGGLVNLGNTCYLNSALQMLASLNDFCLPRPPASLGDEEEQDSSTSLLRDTLRDILARLQQGETLNPSQFKKVVDERSPLFVGYRQQDSHEFLTTLLDLLDEDYHRNQQHANDDETDNDKQDEAMQEEEDENEQVLEEPNERQEQQDGGDDDKEQESPLNVGIETHEATMKDAPAMPRSGLLLDSSRSLSELKNDDICQLLHGSSHAQSKGLSSSIVMGQAAAEDCDNEHKDDSRIEMATTAAVPPPQCKLVGGRAAVPIYGVVPKLSTSTAATSADGDALLVGTDELALAVPDSTAQTSNDDVQEQPPQDHNEQPTTPIEEYFTTEVRAQLTCDSCKYTRSHVEKYLHLSLDIVGTSDNHDSSSSAGGSVEEGLRKFFAPEHRDVKCEKCFCETATQTLEISKLPRALLIHCKRFLVDVSPDYSSITYRKNQSPFSYGDTLSIRQEGSILGEFLAEDVDVAACSNGASIASQWAAESDDGDDDMGVVEDDQPCYRIRSVVNHIGSSASCGHYTCDANRVYPTSGNNERQWTRFNDSRVSHISAEDAMGASAQRTAYMVMYELE